MQVHAFDIVHYEPGRIDAFLATMFHGTASRDGLEDPWHEMYDLLDAPRIALEVCRNGWLAPPVFCPADNLVVSQSLMDKLQGLPNIRFFEVRFSKLVHWEFRVGDLSHKEHPLYKDPDVSAEDFIRALPDVPVYDQQVGRFFEVLTHSAGFLERWYPAAKEVRVGYTEGAKVSAEMLAENPIVWHVRCFFLNEQAYEILAPHLDPDFFRHYLVEI